MAPTPITPIVSPCKKRIWAEKLQKSLQDIYGIYKSSTTRIIELFFIAIIDSDKLEYKLPTRSVDLANVATTNTYLFHIHCLLFIKCTLPLK